MDGWQDGGVAPSLINPFLATARPSATIRLRFGRVDKWETFTGPDGRLGWYRTPAGQSKSATRQEQTAGGQLPDRTGQLADRTGQPPDRAETGQTTTSHKRRRTLGRETVAARLQRFECW